MSSTVLVVTNGSRGDCQPYVAIALAFMKRGYKVTIFTNPEHETLVASHDVGFRSNAYPFKDFFREEKTRKIFTTGSMVAYLDHFGKYAANYTQPMYKMLHKTVAEVQPNLIICGMNHFPDALWCVCSTGGPQSLP